MSIKLEQVVLASPEQMEKDIPNHPCFKARTDGTIIGKRGRPMKGYVDRCGYREVLLSENGKTNNARVHRLIAETFIPNPYNLRDVNHWVSHSSNVKHAYDNGLEKKVLGEDNHGSKLNDELVRYIRQSNKSNYGLAKELGVDPSTIRDARNKKTWRHVI